MINIEWLEETPNIEWLEETPNIEWLEHRKKHRTSND